MKKLLFITLLVLFSFQSVTFAADLDQPVTNTSLKSEIHRGFLMYNVFAEKSGAGDGYQFDYQVPKAINQNVLNGHDSEGFNLGVYFSTWIKINNAIDTWVPLYVKYPNDPPEELEKEKQRDIQDRKQNDEFALKYYNKFRELQTQWGIDDKKLCEINDVDYTKAKPWFEKWWSKTHPQQ